MNSWHTILVYKTSLMLKATLIIPTHGLLGNRMDKNLITIEPKKKPQNFIINIWQPYRGMNHSINQLHGRSWGEFVKFELYYVATFNKWDKQTKKEAILRPFVLRNHKHI